MKLSEIKGERAFDVIADIIDPIAVLAQDEDVKKLFSKAKCPEGVSPRAFVIQRVKEGVPTLLRNHKREITVVLAAIAGVEPDEYLAGLTLASLTQDCYELLTDEAFIDFFISAQSDPLSSGSAQESSAEAPSEASVGT